MQASVIWRNARAAIIELNDGGFFETDSTWDIEVNGEKAGTTERIDTGHPQRRKVHPR